MIETVVTSECSVICRPIGGLDWVGAVYLRDAIAGVLQPEVDLVIDFSMVSFVDADGIIALRNSMELVQLVGGRTRFCGMSSDLADSFEFAMLGVDHAAPIEPAPECGGYSIA